VRLAAPATFGLSSSGLWSGVAEDLISALEARAIWARYGL